LHNESLAYGIEYVRLTKCWCVWHRGD